MAEIKKIFIFITESNGDLVIFVLEEFVKKSSVFFSQIKQPLICDFLILVSLVLQKIIVKIFSYHVLSYLIINFSLYNTIQIHFDENIL